MQLLAARAFTLVLQLPPKEVIPLGVSSRVTVLAIDVPKVSAYEWGSGPIHQGIWGTLEPELRS